jgi:SAM-dependent methyltransferase
MRAETIERIHTINLKFYQSFAEQFAATRGRLQPGAQTILERIPASVAVLDLGCGNGLFVSGLRRRGHTGPYIGVDQSETLLRNAAESSNHPCARFLQLDLTDPAWVEKVQTAMDELHFEAFDRAVGFAFLHHIPGADTRIRLLRAVASLLDPDGKAHLSTWNFMASARLRARIVPWQEVGLDAQDVEEKDYLLDWRRGGRGLRYVHHFDEQELEMLADQAGFGVVETFYSDGEGGRLGLYQTWVKAPASGKAKTLQADGNPPAPGLKGI